MKILETNKQVHLTIDVGEEDPNSANSWFEFGYIHAAIITGDYPSKLGLRQMLSLSDITVDRATGVKTCFLIVTTVCSGDRAVQGVDPGQYGHLATEPSVVGRALFKLEL